MINLFQLTYKWAATLRWGVVNAHLIRGLGDTYTRYFNKLFNFCAVWFSLRENTLGVKDLKSRRYIFIDIEIIDKYKKNWKDGRQQKSKVRKLRIRNVIQKRYFFYWEYFTH